MTTEKTENTPEEIVLETEEAINLDQMYAETFKNLEEGSVVPGTVVALWPEGIVVDIGYKSEGMIPRSEFSEEELKTLEVGHKLQIYLEEQEDSDGNIVLSKEKADRMKVWDQLENVHHSAEVVEGKVLSKIKGGMIVDIGVKAFLPGSQVDVRPTQNLDLYLGKTISVRVIKMNQKRGNIVVSRRAVLEDSRNKRRSITLSSLKEGEVIEGMVKNITDYGVFIDLGDIDGLLHITDMAWGRINHPSELMSLGDSVQVMVLKYDRESGRVSLGLKQLTPDPWDRVKDQFKTGTKIKGRVVSIAGYGAFVELEPGVEGLVHISEMSWTEEVKHPSLFVAVNDQIEVVILNIDRKNRKVSLGMKQIEHNPWDLVEKNYAVDARVQGKVKSITDFGVFVGLAAGIDGLIHISDISWTRHIHHPSEVFQRGQEIETIVLKVDRERERISLGHKQLTPDPWQSEIPEKFIVGQEVNAQVARIVDFGVFILLEDGIEGLMHVSEIGQDISRSSLEQQFPVGDPIVCRIEKVDSVERKIALRPADKEASS